MGLIAFCVLAFVVLVIGAVANWAIDSFAPGHPVIVNKLIWGLAVLILLYTILTATGVLSHDIRIPHL